MEKCLKFILKTRKENVHLATQANHHFVASRSLTPVHSKVTKHSKLYTIFHKLNCKSKFIIYLMECTLCKVLYVEKAETAITTIGNHRKNAGKTKQPQNRSWYEEGSEVPLEIQGSMVPPLNIIVCRRFEPLFYRQSPLMTILPFYIFFKPPAFGKTFLTISPQ